MKFKKFDLLDNRDISAIGLGCWSYGGTWNNTNDEKSKRIIRTAFKNGINFFDVAPVYGKGHAEIVLGEALKELPRKEVIIATKCGLVWREGERSRKDLSRDSSYFK